MRPAFLFLVLSVPAWAWQEPQSNPQLALIRQVRQRMAENLTALPNYTCLETTDHYLRMLGSVLDERAAIQDDTGQDGDPEDPGEPPF